MDQNSAIGRFLTLIAFATGAGANYLVLTVTSSRSSCTTRKKRHSRFAPPLFIYIPPVNDPASTDLPQKLPAENTPQSTPAPKYSPAQNTPSVPVTGPAQGDSVPKSLNGSSPPAYGPSSIAPPVPSDDAAPTGLPQGGSVQNPPTGSLAGPPSRRSCTSGSLTVGLPITRASQRSNKNRPAKRRAGP
ncbi:uncharacterized protein LACBIDRAFT_312272 [Laccaria bicolor S238N-H82]|uniref:Predicted protein n=1 Tax=Laccaria bicolor (strain S238N-H82 / ATCC MYA-4686) TaxID=486041 RepID=B0DVV3_LACBS|nr:uncharacterized protein LACBIDRAFT_312272 [Laccaria bicolor S238N-H82]EDR01365.1 predicted protein [Laccaria bicolor S238N-H82]|eukprot:XP_001888072.1 predicted protein [Laccaria bicolor S238N-H82]